MARKRRAAPNSARGTTRGGRGGTARSSAFAGSLLQRSLVLVVALKALLLLVAFDPNAEQAFDLPKALASHGLAWVLAALLVVTFARYGQAVLPKTRLHIAVLMLLAVVGLSTVWAEPKAIALFGDRGHYQGATFYLDMAVLYVSVAVAFLSIADWAVLGGALTLALTLNVLYAGIQRLGLDPIHWSVSSQARPFSTFGNPDPFGEVLSVALTLAVGVAVAANGVQRERLRWGAGLLAVMLLATVAIVATRGAVVGIVPGALTLAVAYVVRSGLHRAVLVRAAAAILLGTLVLAVALVLSPLGPRVLAAFNAFDVQGRTVLWENALRGIAERPVLGYGPDGFAVSYPLHRSVEAANTIPSHQSEVSAHNWVLQTAVTLGVPGLVALLTVLIAFHVALWRRLAEGGMLATLLLATSAAYWSQGLVSVGTVAVDWVPWVIFGGIATLAGERAEATARRAPSARAVAATIAISAAVGLTATSALAASEAAHRAFVAIVAEQPAAAVASARVAVDRDAGRGEHWNVLGLALDMTQQWRASGDAYAAAAARAPHEAPYWANLARSRARQAIGGDTSSGGFAAALDAARRSVAADPNNTEPNSVLAEVANAAGRYQESLTAAVKAIAVDPIRASSSNEVIAASAAPRLDDAQFARTKLEEMVASKDTARLRIALARADLRLSDVNAALENVRRALQLQPESGEARQMLAELGG